jgi:hypothetical protein
MYTTPQDYFKTMTTAFAALPKTPEAMKDVMEKTKKVVETEMDNVKKIISVSNKASTGNASINELSSIKDTTKDLLVTARFAAVLTIPGVVFALPVLSKLADEYSFDFVPKSVKKEFAI